MLRAPLALEAVALRAGRFMGGSGRHLTEDNEQEELVFLKNGVCRMGLVV